MKKQGRGDLHGQNIQKNELGERCQICGRIEKNTVGADYRGEVIWICRNCYKQRKEKKWRDG